MLNELYDAASSLADADISPKDWHKEYVPVRAPKIAFFVYLDQQGGIAGIERIRDQAEVAELRTWESKGDLRQSFPYFNIPPLLWISFDPKQNDGDKLIEKALKTKTLTEAQFSQFLERVEKAKSTKGWDEKAYRKLQSCLEKGRVLKPILGQAPDELRSIVGLIDRLENVSAQKFYDRLRMTFIGEMRKHPEMAAGYFEGMFYSGAKEPGNAVSLFLELADSISSDRFPAKHQKVRDWVNRRLLSRNPVQERFSSTHDIFGNDGTGWKQSFDDVRMKNALGNVKLRSMAAAAACQRRYGRAEAESCPVGQESRRKMKGALEWLTGPTRKGKTWVAAGNDEILLAYPSELPSDPPGMATFFGGSTETNADNTARFEDCAQNVAAALRGLMAKNPDLDIRVFVLRKMDPARRRVSSQKRYSAQHLIGAAEAWQRGCRNLPLILVKRFSKEREAEWRAPDTPFPMEVVWVFNTSWSRGGKGKADQKGHLQWSPTSIKGIATEDGIALLLEDGVFLQAVLQRALYSATRNASGLVLALGQAHAQGEVFPTAKNYARQVLLVPSVLGLLLSKLNINKENYMKSAPYLVGRLLSLADQLHYHYCQYVRDRNVPPQLMGNALMPTALEEPVKALALYSNRVLPYQAWGRTATGDAAGLARYFLAELGKVCSDISLTEIPERCTDADKAQMLVGYLARSEKSDSETPQQGEKE